MTAPEVHRPAQVLPPVADEPVFDASIPAVIERLIIQKSRNGISSVTQQQYRSFGALFGMITGLTDVRGIRKQHVSRFRDVLQQMPKSWGKSPKDAHATLSEMLAKAKSLPPDQVGLAPGTINRHLDHLAQLLSQADDDGIWVDEKAKPAKLRVKEENATATSGPPSASRSSRRCSGTPSGRGASLSDSETIRASVS